MLQLTTTRWPAACSRPALGVAQQGVFQKNSSSHLSLTRSSEDDLGGWLIGVCYSPAAHVVHSSCSGLGRSSVASRTRIAQVSCRVRCKCGIELQTSGQRADRLEERGVMPAAECRRQDELCTGDEERTYQVVKPLWSRAAQLAPQHEKKRWMIPARRMRSR